MKTQIQKYRVELGRKGHHLGGIDTRTGVTTALIDSVVSRSGDIKSAEDMFLNFEIWDKQYADALFKIIIDVCEK